MRTNFFDSQSYHLILYNWESVDTQSTCSKCSMPKFISYFMKWLVLGFFDKINESPVLCVQYFFFFFPYNFSASFIERNLSYKSRFIAICPGVCFIYKKQCKQITAISPWLTIYYTQLKAMHSSVSFTDFHIYHQGKNITKCFQKPQTFPS